MSKFTLHSLKITVSASYSQVDYQTFLEKSVAQVRCPKCKSKYYLKNHDWYPRHLYISPDERLVIRMRRLKCSSCMITFIVLPPTVIPYKRYVMETIYSVLKQLTTHSIYWLEKNRGFNAKLLRYWFDQYRSFHQPFINLYHPLACDLAQLYQTYWPGHRFMQLISVKPSHFFQV